MVGSLILLFELSDLGDPLADQRLEVSVFDTNKSSDKAGHFPLLGRHAPRPPPGGVHP
jgi:hypothetical protein